MKLFVFLREVFYDLKLLLRNIPSLTVAIFILSVVCANLMANKELINYKFLALDCGYFFSWIMFLTMDVICKRFGAKASVKISVVALVINLFVTLSFALLSETDGMWGAYYATGNIEVNQALNATFASSWFVVLGSSLAFFTGSVVNAFFNHGIAKKTKLKGFWEFALRSYISTFIAQFSDNLVFSCFIAKFFFGWSWQQVFLSSFVAALIELSLEIVFSGFGYRIVLSWQKEGVGQEYLDKQKSGIG
ncbi:MAG: VUT family protein [Spirochaetaceae bacterium]|nr:VUT family protein [Spirochaetaceae bacterium]